MREPEGNGCAERFIRTLKENLLWVRRFDTIEELRLALLAFRQTYNQSWIIERHGYKTPAQVRADQIGHATHGRVSADRCLKTVDRYSALECCQQHRGGLDCDAAGLGPDRGSLLRSSHLVLMRLASR